MRAKAQLWVGAAVLLICLAAQTILGMRTKSATADEFYHHVASGYSYWMTGNFKMNPASPPFPRLLASAPLYLLGAKAPLDHESWKVGDSPEFAKQFFFHANHAVDRFIFWARIPIVFLSALFGLTIFLFSKRLFGGVAALFSLGLYCFCPNIIAHSGLATADLSVAFFFFLTLICFYSYLIKPSKTNAAWTGIAAGMTFLSKFSAVILLPILLLVALAGGKRKELRLSKMGIFAVSCFLTIWAGYFFELKPLLKDTPDPSKKMEMYQKVGGEKLLEFAQKVPVPLSTFSSAFISMMFTRARGVDAYLMGEWSRNGWWYYYFVAFLIKNSIPFILAILLSFILIKKVLPDRLTIALISVPVIFLFFATLNDKAQAGIRYFLPIYPILFVLCGGALAFIYNKTKVMKVFVIGLMGWHVCEALFIFPNHLAYFNEFVGGPKNGYRYLRDSNLDWGQEMKRVGEYVRQNDVHDLALSTIGPVDPSLPARAIRDSERSVPEKTVYAIGAHRIDQCEWTLSTPPSAVIGYSMFIYDFRDKKEEKNV